MIRPKKTPLLRIFQEQGYYQQARDEIDFPPHFDHSGSHRHPLPRRPHR